jgi:hypothetical protein
MPSLACVSARACRWLGHGGELRGGTPGYAPDWGRLARYAPTQARPKVRLGLDYTTCTQVQSRGTGRRHGLVRRRRLMLVRVRVHMRAHVHPGRARHRLVGSVLSVWVPTTNRARRALVGTRSTRCKARSARVAVGSGTCKTTGMARRPALKRRRVCAAARCGQQATGQHASAQGSVIHGSKAGSTAR